MTETSFISREATQHIPPNDVNFNAFNPAYRSTLSHQNETSGLSSLAQRFRENWLKCNPSFRENDDSLTNLTWLFDMSPFSLESDGITAAQHSTIPTDRSTVFSNAKISWQPQHPYAGSLLDPQVRMDYRTKWTGKPPFSYASLICLAMRELGKPKVTLSDIYGWIMTNFAYYRHTDSSWQNSVRHNLSLNKCFEKVPREKGERGKGGFWRVNPRHADWLEANLAKCRRAAPPPGPPPPIPRSLLLEKQQQQQQADASAVAAAAAGGAGLYFSFPQHQLPSVPQQVQPQVQAAQPTLICYQSLSATPDVSNEVEAVSTTESHAQTVPPAPLPHVRRRKTPPCAMYPSGPKCEMDFGEADLVEVRRPSHQHNYHHQHHHNHHQYPAFSNRKRLALAASSSSSASRHRSMYSSTSMWSGVKREPPSMRGSGYYEPKWWKSEDTGMRGSTLPSASSALRRRRTREMMDTSDPFYMPPRRPTPTTPSASTMDTFDSSVFKPPTSSASFFDNKRRADGPVTRNPQPEDLLPDSIGLPCLDSLPNFNVEPSAGGGSWKDDFLDFPGVLPWQTVSGDDGDHTNLTVECTNGSDLENTNPTIQSSSSSSQSPLASFTSFGQSTASSTSSNADSGVASLVNPSDGLDLGPLDLDFDTVSSALNDLVESTGGSIPPIDVDFSDLACDTTQKPSFSQQALGSDFASDWNFGGSNGVGSNNSTGFYENGLLT